jgi:hypothetical protein
MDRLRSSVRRAAGFWLAASAWALMLGAGAVAADAKGTLQVTHADGSVETFHDVSIKVDTHKALTITSADGEGVIVIDKAACDYTGDIQKCLPYSMTLTDHGNSHQLDFQRGTIYANLTSEKQQLPLSSTQLPPNGVSFVVQTKRGTYFTLNGVADVVIK